MWGNGSKCPRVLSAILDLSESTAISFASCVLSLLSIVAMEYPYWFLQQSFGCSPNTITAAKVHRILFGRGGVPPANLKFQRQRVNPCILEELSDFFHSDDVSRASSCRSVVIDGEETPVRYWKDSIDSIIQQYCLEFPGCSIVPFRSGL